MDYNERLKPLFPAEGPSEEEYQDQPPTDVLNPASFVARKDGENRLLPLDQVGFKAEEARRCYHKDKHGYYLVKADYFSPTTPFEAKQHFKVYVQHIDRNSARIGRNMITCWSILVVS